VHVDKLLRFQEYFVVHKKNVPSDKEKPEQCATEHCNTTGHSPATLSTQVPATQLGDLHVLKTEYSQAIQLYTQALTDLSKSNRDDPSKTQTEAMGVLNSRALCYFHIQKYQKSLTDLNYVISMDPMCKNAYNIRASVFLAMDNQQAAALDYMRLSEIEKNALVEQETEKTAPSSPAENSNSSDSNPIDYRKSALNPHAVLNTSVVVLCFSIALTCICISIFR